MQTASANERESEGEKRRVQDRSIDGILKGKGLSRAIGVDGNGPTAKATEPRRRVYGKRSIVGASCVPNESRSHTR
jgi:hypothetical protein